MYNLFDIYLKVFNKKYIGVTNALLQYSGITPEDKDLLIIWVRGVMIDGIIYL